MRGPVYKDELIEEIEKNIEQYDRILISHSREEETDQLVRNFVKSEALQNTTKKVILYGDCENFGNVPFREISQSEYEKIVAFYRLYEFSDRVKVISASNQYGSMRNYLSNGILSQEEYFEALLH